MSSLEIPHAYSTNVSSNSGYTKNYKPNLITLPGTDVHSRLTWVGERTTEYEDEETEAITQVTEKRALFRGSSPTSPFWNFGSNVRGSVIQKTNNHQNYFVVWNQFDSLTKETNNTTLSTIKTINSDGQQVDVCNGYTNTDVYGMIFNSSQTPYSFDMTNNLQSYFSLSKETAGSVINAGREGTVTKDNTCFYYSIGDVIAEGVNIQFGSMDENTAINSNNDVKKYLETEPFELNNNSEFLYSVQYGSSNNNGTIFGNNEYLNFKVKLIEANTNSVIAVFDDVTFNNNNQSSYANLQFNVNTNGIGEKTVKLILEISDNFNAVYSVTAKYDNSTILAKTQKVNIGLGDNTDITTYDISQNYPNPFNPSTIISYQIPEDGMVTLKVYDILGREVKTLVNDFKTKGRYEIVFDASQFASGLYIYEITSGSFKASKKMTLIK